MQLLKEKKPMYAQKEHPKGFYLLIIGKTIFLIGVLLLSTAIIYMLMNFQQAGAVRMIWFTYLMAGAVLIVSSMLFTDINHMPKS